MSTSSVPICCPIPIRNLTPIRSPTQIQSLSQNRRLQNIHSTRPIPSPNCRNLSPIPIRNRNCPILNRSPNFRNPNLNPIRSLSQSQNHLLHIHSSRQIPSRSQSPNFLNPNLIQTPTLSQNRSSIQILLWKNLSP